MSMNRAPDNTLTFRFEIGEVFSLEIVYMRGIVARNGIRWMCSTCCARAAVAVSNLRLGVEHVDTEPFLTACRR